MPPTVVLVVEDHRTLELRFRLPERALMTLKVGNQVDAVFSSVGLKRAATVSRISPNVDPRTRTVEVVAEIPNAESELKAGMLADVRVGGGAPK